MNRNNANRTIFLRSKPSRFISDEEIAKINEEIPFGHLAQNLKRTEEICRENMRKLLMPYYENLSQDIELVHGVDTEREDFLKQVRKSMKNYLDDTLSDGTDREAFYILRYFLEIRGQISGGANMFGYPVFGHNQKNAIEAILHKYL